MTRAKPVVAVVENDAALLKALERLLRAHGYPSELYTNAEAFLDRKPEKEIGCLILDIDLDGISGLQLQHQLVKKGQAPPIIFITGQGDDSSLKQAQDLGCIAYLKKPFESCALIKALSNAADAG